MSKIEFDDSGNSKPHRKTKCVGRFPEIRDGLVETVNFMYTNSDPHYKVIIRNHLDEIFSVILNDIPAFDINDSYFLNKADSLRTDFSELSDVSLDSGRFDIYSNPIEDNNIALGIVPLITTDVPVNSTLVLQYAKMFGINPKIEKFLPLFFKEVDTNPDGAERLDAELMIRMHDIMVPDKDDPKKEIPLQGYKLAAGFGIGPNKLVTLAYDAPFHIELHVIEPGSKKYDVRTEKTGVLGIGFWLNKFNQMLVGQIQAMRGGKLPHGAQLGTAALKIAEKVAREMGFDSIITYSANEHPQFRMHPDSRAQMIGDFKCYHDSSAKNLGWSPITRSSSPNDYHVGYIKHLTTNSQRISENMRKSASGGGRS